MLTKVKGLKEILKYLEIVILIKFKRQTVYRTDLLLDMFLELVCSSEINNSLVKIINQLVSEFNIHSPVTSQSEFLPDSETNPDTEFTMVTPILT